MQTKSTTYHSFLIFIALFLCVNTIEAQNPYQGNLFKMTPDLAIKIEEKSDKYLEIFIVLEMQADVNSVVSASRTNEISLEKRQKKALSLLKQVSISSESELMESLYSLDGVDFQSIQSHWLINGISLRAKPSAIKKISHFPSVLMIEMEDIPILDEPTEMGASSGSLNGREPGHDLINAPKLWEMGYTGYGRRVMIFDSGNDHLHPSAERSFAWHNHPLNEVWAGFGDYVMDCMSHGTHVGGTVTGLDRITNDTIGVAFNAEWISGPIAFAGCNRPFFQPLRSRVATFEWALNPDGDFSTIDDMPDVINCSWRSASASCHDESSRILMNNVQALGIAVVFSAGNNGPDSSTVVSYAGINNDLVNVFSVGAVDFQSEIADFSSRGPAPCPEAGGSLAIKPEVSAPGVGVRSAITGGGFANFNGTSMAAPHVSGAFLLLKEAFPYLDGETLLLALYFSAVDKGEPGENNTYGMGIIDVYAAFQYLIDQGYDPLPPADNRLDLVLVDVNISDGPVCLPQSSAIYTIQNAGLDTVMSFQLAYHLKGNPAFGDSLMWEGIILPGEIIEFQIPLDQIKEGRHTLISNISSPNSEVDSRPINNQFKKEFSVLDSEPLAAEIGPFFAGLNCTGSRVILDFLTEASDDQRIEWFNTPSGGSVLDTGAQFITDPLFSSTSFYVDLISNDFVGKVAPNPQTSLDVDLDAGLLFDAHQRFTLKSIDLYVENPGLRRVELRDKRGNVLRSRQLVIFTPGMNTIDLDFVVPAGRDHRLVKANITGPGFTIDFDAADFPYEIDDIVSIKSSVIAEEPFPGFNETVYSYFYNWKIEYGSACGRSEIPVELLDSAVNEILIFTDTTDIQLEDGFASVPFVADWPDGLNFHWDFGNGTTAIGEEVTAIYNTPGLYSVVVSGINEEGCASLATLEINVSERPVSTVNEFVAKKEIRLFPNPANETLQLMFSEPINFDIDVSIFNMMGQIVSQINGVQIANTYTIEISELPAGFYILSAVDNKGNKWTQPFIKQ